MNLVFWRCPLCNESLTLVERTWVCANRHSFDRAKEGYVNLLLVNRKHSADPGDNKAMLGSRRYFLQQGFYAPLAMALVAAIREHFPDTEQALTVLDAGCGEGYYLNQLVQMLGANVQGYGTDISRAAMRLAAKQYPALAFAVASSFELPLADASVDVLVRVFAPASEAEIVRVLKPGGLYLWAYPAAQHLFELRQLIYDAPQPHTVEELPPLDNMQECPSLSVNYPVTLPDQASIAALLHMTPYYWSASAEKQAHCQRLQSLDLTVDFCVTVMRKGD
ncbi:methyltransferase domain-containing protein [Thiothrix subterranea]|uniref:putative RNA methyltransferase n=1 Tax=Thiothrix subterranea TaxID=2735563 RepID=UPI00192A7F41|nr:methyltransferase domain-containing protein [Thiothrix subterranea]QQZ29764.1 methyltransferase domain-containing protein [Thiothrix subterranea]